MSVVGGLPPFSSVELVMEAWIAAGAVQASLRQRAWEKSIAHGFIIEVPFQGKQCVALGPAAQQL